MGTFLVNFHARAPLTAQSQKAVERVVERGWIANSGDGWFSFWDELASQQDENRIESVAAQMSKSIAAAVIAFLVHDSDIFCYWLYDGGRQIDKYNSHPHYWGDESIDAAALRADCGALAKLCVPGTAVTDLEDLLRQTEDGGDFVFAEERLMKLGPLLGINEQILMSDFGSIGVDLDPDEFGVVALGDVELPAQGSHGEVNIARQVEQLNARAPMHAAVTQGDLAKIEKLVSEGRDINEVPAGMTTTALTVASASQPAGFIRRMVELGADVHKIGAAGLTPLWFAVQAGKLENVRTLIELGADANEHNPQIGTLLHAAVVGGSEELTRELLAAGVDPNRTNAQNMTPLQVAELQLNQLQQMKTMFGESALQRIEPVHQKLLAIVNILKAERP